MLGDITAQFDEHHNRAVHALNLHALDFFKAGLVRDSEELRERIRVYSNLLEDWENEQNQAGDPSTVAGQEEAVLQD